MAAPVSGEELRSLTQLMGHRTHLERQRAQETMTDRLKDDKPVEDGALDAAAGALRPMLHSERWEDRLGGFMAAAIIVPRYDAAGFREEMMDECMRLLEDEEWRVRLEVAKCLRVLAATCGPATVDRVQDTILKSIETNFDRDEDGAGEPGEEEDTDNFVDALLQATYEPQRPGAGEMRHGTEGWKCLETSCRALQGLMEGCGNQYHPYLTQYMRNLVYRTLHHPNRFVRETGHFAVKAMSETLTGDELRPLAKEFALRIGDGLSDNWSQVRFAASVGCRSFMLACPDDLRQELFPLLLPHMCLNRYYVAEGVRLYSQETWRLVMGERGREEVARCIAEVVAYYVAQSKANNHAVREAACACMAELMSKIDKGATGPHAATMLRTLVNCFKDASWPVRDAACNACGLCVLACPEESREVLDELYDLWFAHLWDNIPTVREDSAVALGRCLRAYGDEARERIVPRLAEMLPSAFQQPHDSAKYGGLSNVTQFGVAQEARRARANDKDLHTDQQMFSCGSLAPKLQRGGGCMDHGFARDKEPWEATDGSIYLLRELAAAYPDAANEFLPTVADLAALDSFVHCFNLWDTIWKQIPAIADHLGKRRFKPHVAALVGPAFRALSCGRPLTEAHAAQAIGHMRDMLGPNIFAGRLNDEQLRQMQASALIPAAKLAVPVVVRPGAEPGRLPQALPGVGSVGHEGNGGAMIATAAPWAR
ncbi:unnamed protein product [Pedinophyceae sp. YPF-701]|nr:unnamed protein product [Pedinophyceae sp. YPF-701]